MRVYFGYIRVSTVKQGEHGSSLQEQRTAIEAYASRFGLKITRWFEERETAAKLGRRMFNQMLADLNRGRAQGVVIHKIDRSARNLKDWAHLGEMMDRGIDVHFAHDNLDLGTRGGRLSADIQAVVAADFIRNLRDEVRKGFYGRLKQGFYPLPAPRGYLNCGKAKAKEIDPVEGPLVQQAFELYATASYGLDTLRAELHRRGLGQRNGTRLSRNGMSKLLRNPFYIGLMRVRRTGELFEGKHRPLVTKKVFDRVQDVLSGRLYPRIEVHRFLFRRLVRCGACDRALTGERQKGHIYYRCHGVQCRGTSLSEAVIDACVRENLADLRFNERDVGDVGELVRQQKEIARESLAEQAGHIRMDLARIDDRLIRLTDAFLDGSIDKEAYDRRREDLLLKQRSLRDHEVEVWDGTFWDEFIKQFELGNSALLSYETAKDDEKRDVLKSVSSNLLAHGKKPAFPMLFPYDEIRNWRQLHYGESPQGAVRNGDRNCQLGKFSASDLALHIRGHIVEARKQEKLSSASPTEAYAGPDGIPKEAGTPAGGHHPGQVHAER